MGIGETPDGGVGQAAVALAPSLRTQGSGSGGRVPNVLLIDEVAAGGISIAGRRETAVTARRAVLSQRLQVAERIASSGNSPDSATLNTTIATTNSKSEKPRRADREAARRCLRLRACGSGFMGTSLR